jgi:hypothetical protein
MRPEEDEGMSEENKIIHHRSQVVSLVLPKQDLITDDWAKVTCGSCRLERPLAEPERAPEYRVLQHVLDTDRRLGLADELAAAEREYATMSDLAAAAAREAERASRKVARIRTLLAEEEPAWRAPTPWHARAAAAISEGSARLSKPGPY